MSSPGRLVPPLWTIPRRSDRCPCTTTSAPSATPRSRSLSAAPVTRPKCAVPTAAPPKWSGRFRRSRWAAGSRLRRAGPRRPAAAAGPATPAGLTPATEVSPTVARAASRAGPRGCFSETSEKSRHGFPKPFQRICSQRISRGFRRIPEISERSSRDSRWFSPRFPRGFPDPRGKLPVQVAGIHREGHEGR